MNHLTPHPETLSGYPGADAVHHVGIEYRGATISGIACPCRAHRAAHALGQRLAREVGDEAVAALMTPRLGAACTGLLGARATGWREASRA